MSVPGFAGTSHYQQAVLDFVESGTGHGIVEATAGSGKTTTLVKVASLLEAKVLEPGQRACFLAFNRSTARELRVRLPAAVDATTIHALGRRMLLNSTVDARLDLDDTKYLHLALESLASSGSRALAELDPLDAATYMARLAGHVHLELTDPSDTAAVHDVGSRYRLRSPSALHAAALNEVIPDLLSRGSDAGRNGMVDFTDLVYLPLRFEVRPPPYAFVCVDEAQDLSRVNLELVMRLLT